MAALSLTPVDILTEIGLVEEPNCLPLGGQEKALTTEDTEVPHLRRFRLCRLEIPALTGWGNLWRASGAVRGATERKARVRAEGEAAVFFVGGEVADTEDGGVGGIALVDLLEGQIVGLDFVFAGFHGFAVVGIEHSDGAVFV